MRDPWTAACHDPLIRRLLKLFTPEVYLVGGCVRDFCLGLTPADYDIVIFGDVWALADAIAGEFGAYAFWMDQPRGIARIALKSKDSGETFFGKQVSPDPFQKTFTRSGQVSVEGARSAPSTDTCPEQDKSFWEGSGGPFLQKGSPRILTLDVCAPKAATIEEDLAQRDITINAMACSPAGLIDPLGGLADLENGIIRAISAANLADDPLRVLRCLRFAVQLGFTITDGTMADIRRFAPRLPEVAPERIKQELCAALTCPTGSALFALMESSGIRAVLFPQYVDLDQGCHHRWPLVQHAVFTARAIDDLLAEAERYLPGVGPYFSDVIEDGLSRAALLRLAAFLHDIGKPRACYTTEDGAVHFHGHAQIGARQSAAILTGLRFSSEAVRLAGVLVEHHMRVLELAVGGVITNRAIHRYLKAVTDCVPEALLLVIADAEATGKDPGYTGARPDIEAIVGRIWTYYQTVFTVQAQAPLLSGNDVMEALGIGPGPEVGRLLNAVEEARAEGIVRTWEEAIEYVKSSIPPSPLDLKGG